MTCTAMICALVRLRDRKQRARQLSASRPKAESHRKGGGWHYGSGGSDGRGVDYLNEEKQLSVFKCLTFWKNIDTLGSTIENSNQESHLQIPGLLVLGGFFL